MTEEFYVRRVKNWDDIMRKYIFGIVGESKTVEVLNIVREINDNYYDSLFEMVHQLKISRSVLEQYLEDLNEMYKGYDGIIDALYNVRTVVNNYE